MKIATRTGVAIVKRIACTASVADRNPSHRHTPHQLGEVPND
jgi:hypothetical protein